MRLKISMYVNALNIFMITSSFMLPVAGNASDWMSFWLSPNAIDPTGMTSAIAKAKLDIHCVQKCLANITCTGMNYRGDMFDQECQLFYGTHVSDFTMITDTEASAILPFPRSCAALKTKHGDNARNGVYDFFDTDNVEGGIRRSSFRAYCDQQTDGGGWTVIQRRLDGSVDFYRGWDEYKTGFGNMEGEYWLGLNRIHLMTSAQPTELRIDLEDFDGNKKFAQYSIFRVANESAGFYKLTISGYQQTSTVGDSMEQHNGHSFSTMDADHDTNSQENCAVWYHGAWWYKACHAVNLNGYYKGGPHESFADGIAWESWRGYYYSLKFSEMKVRPLNFG